MHGCEDDCVCDVVSGGEGCGYVKWLIFCCFVVLIYDRWSYEGTDICTSRVAFANEKIFNSDFKKFLLITLCLIALLCLMLLQNDFSKWKQRLVFILYFSSRDNLFSLSLFIILSAAIQFGDILIKECLNDSGDRS